MPSGGDRAGGGARRLAEALAGVRRTSIKAGRYKAGGVDEAQRRREEEEGESVGGRDRNGVLGAGGELGRGGRR